MSRRALLSSEQRARLFGIPVDQAEMARHYVLSHEDLALVRAKRRAANRLGFAIQLCTLRYPGRALEPLEAPPAPMLVFIGSPSLCVGRHRFLKRICLDGCRAIALSYAREIWLGSRTWRASFRRRAGGRSLEHHGNDRGSRQLP